MITSSSSVKSQVKIKRRNFTLKHAGCIPIRKKQMKVYIGGGVRDYNKYYKHKII